jgi:hypothetical protein
VSVTPSMSVPTLPSSVLRQVTSTDSSRIVQKQSIFIRHFHSCVERGFLWASSEMVSVTPFMSVPTLPSSVLRLVTSPDSFNTACRSK